MTPSIQSFHSRERLREWDIARGFGVLFLVASGCLEHFAHPSVFGQRFVSALEILTSSLSTPLFAVALGFFACLRWLKNTDQGWIRGLAPTLRRSLKLLAVGFALNIWHRTLPILIGREFGMGFSLSPTQAFLQFDFFHFAALALVLLALLRPALSTPSGAAWGFGLFALSSHVATSDPERLRGMSEAVPFLLGGSKVFLFPLVGWFTHPLCGVLLAHVRESLVGKLENRRVKECGPGALRLWNGLLGATGGAALALLAWAFPHAAQEARTDFFETSGGSLAWSIASVLLLLALCGHLSTRHRSGFIDRLAAMGRCLTLAYILRWLVLVLAFFIFGLGKLQAGPLALVSTAILGMTLGLTWWVDGRWPGWRRFVD